jgi:hypothetical protein
MRLLFLCFLVTLLPCLMLAQPFDKLHSQVGLSHEYLATSNIGGGVVIIDINNDGWMDLYLPGGRLLDKLFLNMEGQLYSNISSTAGMLQTGWANTQGGIAGDFNNDGFEDLFITTQKALNEFGSPTINARNFLMINNGDNTFTEVGTNYGIIDSSYSVSATSGDFNHDGVLDIYVANYVKVVDATTDPNTGQVNGFAHQCFDNYYYAGSSNMLFDEQAELLGINDAGCSLAAVATDFNWDGNTDLMMVNDFGQWVAPNALYENQNGGFNNVAVSANADVGIYGMGVAAGDFNEDGLLDYYITNLGRNVLLKQLPDHTFIDVSTQLDVGNEFINGFLTTGWSTFFFDYDNDSYLDLFVSNGQMPAAGFIATYVYDPNKLYRNMGDGTFEDVSELLGIADTAAGRGAAFVDFNNDGKLDIVQFNIPMSFNEAFSQPVIYLNQQENDNNWVMFSLKGTSVNSGAIGARMELYAGGRTFIREVDGGSGFASHNDKRLHFGLGEMSVIDSVVVYWPGISEPQIIQSPQINTIHNVIQTDVVTSIDEKSKIWKVYPNPAQEMVWIQFESVLTERTFLQLCDLNGRRISQQTLPIGFSGKLQIPLSIPAGIYLLQIQQKNSASVHKIVVVE